MISKEELIQIRNSLKECDPDVENFSWGPTLEFARQRKNAALKLLDREIRNYRETDSAVIHTRKS